MMGTITVRQATPADAAELARIVDPFDGIGADPERVSTDAGPQSVLTTFKRMDQDSQPSGLRLLGPRVLQFAFDLSHKLRVRS